MKSPKKGLYVDKSKCIPNVFNINLFHNNILRSLNIDMKLEHLNKSTL